MRWWLRLHAAQRGSWQAPMCYSTHHLRHFLAAADRPMLMAPLFGRNSPWRNQRPSDYRDRHDYSQRSLIAEDARANVILVGLLLRRRLFVRGLKCKCLTRAPLFGLFLWHVRHACNAGLSRAPVAPENMKALHAPGSLAAITCGNLPAKRTMREASQQSITSTPRSIKTHTR